MTNDDFQRAARLWLDDGPTEVPDRVLDAALREIHTTRQRRAWRRVPGFLSTPRMRLGLAAAAVVVATLTGLGVLTSSVGIGGRPLAPSPQPTPTPQTLDAPAEGPLDAGTYVTPHDFLAGVTFTVPSGWHAQVGGPYAVFLTRAAGESALTFQIVDRVFADPCAGSGPLDPQPGPTVDDLATALAGLPGTQATTPVDVTISGYSGKQLTLTAPSSFAGCSLTNGSFRVWQLPLGATKDMRPGETSTISIVDVAGQRLVIDGAVNAGAGAQAHDELDSILASIRLAPRN
jgi:hypothetical protein